MYHLAMAPLGLLLHLSTAECIATHHHHHPHQAPPLPLPAAPTAVLTKMHATTLGFEMCLQLDNLTSTFELI